jgi:hypothetical protein
MMITRTSAFTGMMHTKEILVTEEQIARWQGGEVIQKVMPHLSADDREFLMTGITADEWENAFGEKV